MLVGQYFTLQTLPKYLAANFFLMWGIQTHTLISYIQKEHPCQVLFLLYNSIFYKYNICLKGFINQGNLLISLSGWGDEAF